MEADRKGAVWEPSAAHFERSALVRLYERLGFTSLNAFRERAAAEPAWFWDEMVRDLGVKWTRPPTEVVDLSRGKALARWFSVAGFNYTYAMLDRWVEAGRGNFPALVWE